MSNEGDKKWYQWTSYETVWSSANKIEMLMRGAYKTAFSVFSTFDPPHRVG
jgi:hypothetical protein